MQDYAKLRRNKDERNGFTSFVLHKGAGTTRTGTYDRSSIRMFEERLATEPHGDWLSGSRDSQKTFSQFIIDTSIANDFYIQENQWHLFGERKRVPSGESIIYENAAQGVIYKIRDPFAKLHLKSGRILDVLYDHIAHNLLFSSAQYRLVGVTSYLGEVRFVLVQNMFYTQNVPTQQQIDSYLTSIGLLPEDRYYYGNEYLAVTDVSAASDNVLIDDNGKLLFIDPIIKLKKPIDEVIKAYPFVVAEAPKQGLVASLKEYITRIFRR